MEMLLVFLIFTIIVLGECKIYRYKRSSLLAAACKRYPTLAFCKINPVAQIKKSINTSKPLPLKPPSMKLPSTSKPSPTQPPQPAPPPSEPVPFDRETFSESLISKTNPSRLSSVKPSKIPIRPKSENSESAPQEFVPFDIERFGGRLGGGDFDRIDRLEGSRKEGENSNFQKISSKSRPLTGVDSRLSHSGPANSEPIPFDNESFGTNKGGKDMS